MFLLWWSTGVPRFISLPFGYPELWGAGKIAPPPPRFCSQKTPALNSVKLMFRQLPRFLNARRVFTLLGAHQPRAWEPNPGC